MSTVRAKFKVTETKRTEGYSKIAGDIPQPMVSIVATPVYANNNPEHENSKFWAATPTGQLTMSCVNAGVLDHLNPGDEIYLDITVALK